ncbi:MAG: class I SAM-dependent methyltransferase [bacterium]|nr:class I SAM-dependent methyltransferase [bacterium]
MRDDPKLYTTLADWWQLFSPTSDYADEGGFFISLFQDAGAQTILELGAGGGNVAWYLKKHFKITLTDLSVGMLDMSKKQNPECEHTQGDMRDLRLGRIYDGVLIHDAIMYMLSEADLKAAIQTAHAHLKQGGTLVIAPDCIRETFKETTDYEGHDNGNRGVRYIQWVTDPDPTDTQFNYDFVIALKENGKLWTEIDRQVCGIFPRQTWLDILKRSRFDARIVEDNSTVGETNERTEIFVAVKK